MTYHVHMLDIIIILCITGSHYVRNTTLVTQKREWCAIILYYERFVVSNEALGTINIITNKQAHYIQHIIVND